MAEGPTVTFSTRPRSDKVTCDVCGRTGWGPALAEGQVSTVQRFAPWQLVCLRGHPYGCSCGMAFSTRTGLANHARLSRSGTHDRLDQ